MNADNKTRDPNHRKLHKYMPWQARFWSGIQVGSPDECWLWQRSGIVTGYGMFFINKKRYYVHRIAYELSNGEIPDGKCVCHSCDRPRCCNPKHLFIGTPKQNWDDMRSKKRNPRGNQFPKSKLDAEKVQYIREQKKLGLNARQISEKLGVHRVTVNNVIRGVAWIHVC